MRFIKGFRTKQMDIIFNPYRSLPSILFPQRLEQLEIFTLFLVITGFLFMGEGGEEGGGGEGGAFSWIKARFPRDG